MTGYLLLKWLHIVSSTVLFGTGLGTAFFKWMADRSGDVRAIRIVTEKTVLADWIFTTPAVVIQPLTGLAMVWIAGYRLADAWLLYSMVLYLLAGACWIPVVALQIMMRDIARHADSHGIALPDRYHVLARWWFWLGWPAFGGLVVVFYLMTFKPAVL